MHRWIAVLLIVLAHPDAALAQPTDGTPRALATQLYRMTHGAEPRWPADAFGERDLAGLSFGAPRAVGDSLLEFEARGTVTRRPTDGPGVAALLGRAIGIEVRLHRISWDSTDAGLAPRFHFSLNRPPPPEGGPDRPLTPAREIRSVRPPVAGPSTPPGRARPPPPPADCALEIAGIEGLVTALGWRLKPDRDGRPVSWAVFEHASREYRFCPPVVEQTRVVIEGATCRRRGGRGTLAPGINDVMVALQANAEVSSVKLRRIHNGTFADRPCLRFQIEAALLRRGGPASSSPSPGGGR